MCRRPETAFASAVMRLSAVSPLWCVPAVAVPSSTQRCSARGPRCAARRFERRRRGIHAAIAVVRATEARLRATSRSPCGAALCLLLPQDGLRLATHPASANCDMTTGGRRVLLDVRPHASGCGLPWPERPRPMELSVDCASQTEREILRALVLHRSERLSPELTRPPICPTLRPPAGRRFTPSWRRSRSSESPSRQHRRQVLRRFARAKVSRFPRRGHRRHSRSFSQGWRPAAARAREVPGRSSCEPMAGSSPRAESAPLRCLRSTLGSR